MPQLADRLLETAQPVTAPASFSDADLPTIDALIEEKRQKAPPPVAAQLPPPTQPEHEQEQPRVAEVEVEGVADAPVDAPAPAPGSPEALEEEAGQQGAFNPETGEINWDCPCLGGMAHGPCGEEFKAAFSCFIYSDEEPKGMDCIDKFQYVYDGRSLSP